MQAIRTGSTVATLLVLSACNNAFDQTISNSNPAPAALPPVHGNLPPVSAPASRGGKAWMHGVQVAYEVVGKKAMFGGDVVLGDVGSDGLLINKKLYDAPVDRGTATVGAKGRKLRPDEVELTGRNFDESGFFLDWPGWKWEKADFGDWGVGGCFVPYSIDANMPSDFVDAVHNAAGWFERTTYCRWSEGAWGPRQVHFVYDDTLPDGTAGNSDSIGRGCQYNPESDLIVCPDNDLLIRLRDVNNNTTIHEMLHVLGFFHEHQRPDRDQYIEVVSTNYNYVPFEWGTWQQPYVTQNYDIYSLMHYISHCTWYNYAAVCGYWFCNTGNLFPLGYRSKDDTVECSLDLYAGYRVQVGGDTPTSNDIGSIYQIYPSPPNIPPPPPPPPDPCDNMPPNICYHNPESECCGVVGLKDATPASGYNVLAAWDPNRTYAVGDQVWIGKRWFASQTAHQSSDSPVTDYTNWHGVYEPAKYWRQNTQYPINAVVSYGESSYISQYAHVSDPSRTPMSDQDTWKPYK